MALETKLPDTIDAGTTVTYRRSVPDYPANQGWALTLYLAGKAVLNVAAVAAGADFDVTLTAAQTAGLTPGVYTWLERVVKASEKHDVGRGQVTLLADVATATPGSLQSYEEKTLEILELAISGQLTSGIESYQIAGRAVSKIPVKDLLALRGQFQAAVDAQRGKGGGLRSILVSFTGAENR